MDDRHYQYLDKINSPADLKQVPKEDLGVVAAELRSFIIDEVAKHPGHLGSSLGVVELTVALHYVFDTPYDRIIWDVGHQAYGHKILTGRRDVFHTNRQLGGISGFPTPHDAEEGRAAQGGGRHRRRGHDRRAGLRGAEQHLDGQE